LRPWAWTAVEIEPTVMIASSVARQFNNSATYVDYFDRRHPYAPGVTFPDQDTATVGAYHTADVPYWFDTLDKYNAIRKTRDWTPYDRGLTDTMTAALITPARTGSPATKAQDWPAWSQAKPQYVVFGDSVSVRTMAIKRMDWQAANPPAVQPAEPGRIRARD
jgi:para-nitrobenzyl esterase